MDVEATKAGQVEDAAGQNLAIGRHHNQVGLEVAEGDEEGFVARAFGLEHRQSQFQGECFDGRRLQFKLAATRFVGPVTFEAITRRRVITDQFEAGANSDIEHIALASTIDLLLIAPATANIIGKLANGIADDFLSTLYTATRAPVLATPTRVWTPISPLWNSCAPMTPHR